MAESSAWLKALKRSEPGPLPAISGDAMTELLLYAISIFLCALAALFAFERLIALAIRRIGIWLPSDLCGPEGWLIDTTRRAGVFDRVQKG
ncbi:hypothetical protein ACN2XU_04585 [Primorskyibacter sp. 2E107]|uniref:hypothetical protein n=1 Tax=Primorskyibacter sp. 2E107 TaxID=3403458 RepID=UPI003AF8F514